MTQAEQKGSALTWPLLPKMSWRHILRPIAAAVGKPQVQSVADNTGDKVAPEPIAVVDKLDEVLRSGGNWQYFQVPADYCGDQELVITVGTAANANIAIAIGANVRVHIREQRRAQATRGQLHNEVRLQIGAGAQVRYSTTDNFSGSDVLIYRRAELAANATLDWYAGIFGAVTGAFEHSVELLGTGSQAHVNTAVLAGGSGQLVSGSQQLTAGLTTVAAQTPQLTTGLQQEAAGQKTMYSTLQGTVDQMKTLQSGLTTAGNGVGKINKGVASASSYLSGLQDSAAAQSYYVPKQILKTKDYKTAVKTYMSADHKTTKLTVVLSTDPASATSMKRVDNMQGDVQNALKGTPLKNAKVAIGGQTASTSDTQHIASSDFVRTAAIMIIGILLALMVVTRSILQPLYIIATLAYVASLSLTRLVSGLVLGQHMLTWNTPFFSFVMLIALGVDYSIFLMMKYREFGVQNPDPKKRIVAASGVIGAVVLSAAVILSGTFAALMPSGVLTLIQVALAVIIGLIILVFIIPVILPGLISLTYGERGENGKHSKEANKSEK